MPFRKPQPERKAAYSISFSLRDVYDVLCSDCRERLLDYLAMQAQPNLVREGLRQKLEAKPDDS